VRVAIHRDSDSPIHFAGKWADLLEYKSIQVKWVNLRLPDALDQVRGCDGVMWHWEYLPHERQVAPQILRAIEEYLRIPVFPDQFTCWHYDDKLAQYYIFRALKVLMPPTWIFWDREAAREWAEQTTYPKIFKLKTGSSSSNVHMVPSRKDALSIIELMFGPGTYPRGFRKVSTDLDLLSEKFRGPALGPSNQVAASDHQPPTAQGRYWWQPEKNYVYFQDFLPGNKVDTRVTVIGNRAFGFHRSNRADDFRASGSKLIDFDSARVDLRCIRLALEISAKLRVQSMAYDFLVDQNGNQVVTEMSYIYDDEPIERCQGHWNSELRWIPGRMWPQAAQVEDFVRRLLDTASERAIG
jgi:hypothetical protein